MLIEEFLKNVKSAARAFEASPDFLKRFGPNYWITSGMSVIYQAVKSCEEIHFSHGTMRMLEDRLVHFEKTLKEIREAFKQSDLTREQVIERMYLHRDSAYWIQFAKPVKMDEDAIGISAMLTLTPGKLIETGDDDPQLILVSQTGMLMDKFFFSREGGWGFDPTIQHMYCPFQVCCVKDGVFQPCQNCTNRLEVWNRIYALSCLIAGQYLAARRYEEKEVTWIRRTPRKGNEKKTKRTPVSRIIKVIDANEIVIPIPPPEKPASQPPRESWLTKGDVVYEEIRTRPFTRTYRHKRYIHMRGQTVSFPFGITRRQPYKADRGKRMIKVKASLYGE